MKLTKATHENLMNLQAGSVVLSDIDEHVSDFAIFKGYNEETGAITVVDCLSKDDNGNYNKNISDYTSVMIIDAEEIVKD